MYQYTITHALTVSIDLLIHVLQDQQFASQQFHQYKKKINHLSSQFDEHIKYHGIFR
jgi:hypothetical protein